MSNLRTNYKDDIFTGKRKYTEVNNGDGTISFNDVTEYAQVGDSYGAAQINEHNDILNQLDNSAFRNTDSASTDLADNDYVPFYDSSAGARKRTLWSNIKSALLSTFAQKVHNSNSAGTYGAGTASSFGHVKLTDNYTSNDGAASASVGASSKALNSAYSKLNTDVSNLSSGKAPTNHKSTATTYGVGSTTEYGHLKISDNYTSSAGAASAGVAASSKAVSTAYTELRDETAPTYHAFQSSDPVNYGKGSLSAFGHVMLTDDYTDSDKSANTGVGASGKALYMAWNHLNTNKAKTSHAASDDTYGLGSASKYGHVKLSSATTSDSAPADGIAATPQAVNTIRKSVNDRFGYANVDFTFGIKNGTYGWYENVNRTGTFHPFRSGYDILYSAVGTPSQSSETGTITDSGILLVVVSLYQDYNSAPDCTLKIGSTTVSAVDTKTSYDGRLKTFAVEVSKNQSWTVTLSYGTELRRFRGISVILIH